MLYFVTRLELQSLLSIGRSQSYLLEKQGVLPSPSKVFGKNKLFNLKQSLESVHRHQGWPIPSDSIVESQWRAIIAARLQSS